MALTISCRDMGFSVDHIMTANTTDDIIRQMQEHVVANHGYTEAQVQEGDMVEFLRGAIRQSARPAHLRSPREV